MEKHSLETAKALKLLAGGLGVGAASRLMYNVLANDVMKNKTNYRPKDDLMDAEQEVAVEMTPEQYEEYLRRADSYGLKKRASVGNTVLGLGLAGGGAYAGWKTMGLVIKELRKWKLENELKSVRKELADLVQGVPYEESDTIKKPLRSAVKQAADAAIDRAADAYVKEAALPTARQVFSGFKNRVVNTAGTIKDVFKNNPTSAAVVTGGGLAGLSGLIFAPEYVHSLTGAGGDAVTSAGKTVAGPILTGLAAIIGPIAALSLAAAAHRSYNESHKSSPAMQDNKAVKQLIREQEGKDLPVIKLRPVLSKKEKQEEDIPEGVSTVDNAEQFFLRDNKTASISEALKLAEAMLGAQGVNPVKPQAAVTPKLPKKPAVPTASMNKGAPAITPPVGAAHAKSV